MSMEHKAYHFDHAAYDNELRPLLEDALRTGERAGLLGFIVEHQSSLVDPYEGEALGARWEELVEVEDVHTYGDFALTRYYNPKHDIGLGHSWHELSHILAIPDAAPTPILGRPIGDAPAWFDPGKMGSYIQSAEEVAANAELLRHHPRAAELEQLIRLLDAAPKGLYVTF